MEGNEFFYSNMDLVTIQGIAAWEGHAGGNGVVTHRAGLRCHESGRLLHMRGVTHVFTGPSALCTLSPSV